ncbi:MAG: phospholipid carrier-dependent glycosyltransferase [Saprospiraceae bacterium]
MLSNDSPFLKSLNYFIFAISTTLMITLAIVNDGSANDVHLEVSELIITKGKTPEYTDCWQCYHPKLYHHTVAKLWTWFDITSKESRIILAQLLNAFAGIFTLLICLVFILGQPFSRLVQLFSFSMMALNPRFIAIHAQATNDAFLILFGTLTVYALCQFLKKPSLRFYLIILIASIFAGATKGNSFILMSGVVVVFLLKIISTQDFKFPIGKNYLGSLLFFLIINFLAVGYFGGYFDNHKKYGHPFQYNTPVSELPYLLEKTDFRRPGVQSIASGYFTFRFFDMIKNPTITNEYGDHYPLHRTSVWSQLYGRSHFLYFDNWPAGKWQSNNPTMMNVGRGALILALFPSILFLIGFLKDLKIWWRLFSERSFNFLNKNADWMFSIFNVGFLVFIILFTAVGRDYSFMKVIYLFPGILAAMIPLLKGFDSAFSFLKKSKIGISVFQMSIFVLLVFYVIPILNLIGKLIRV